MVSGICRDGNQDFLSTATRDHPTCRLGGDYRIDVLPWVYLVLASPQFPVRDRLSAPLEIHLSAERSYTIRSKSRKLALGKPRVRHLLCIRYNIARLCVAVDNAIGYVAALLGLGGRCHGHGSTLFAREGETERGPPVPDYRLSQ